MKGKPYKLPRDYLPYNSFEKKTEALSLIYGRPVVRNAPVHNTLTYAAYYHQKWAEGYPLYCVRESLLEDMLETDVGDNLPLFEDIELAIPTYALFFPKNSLPGLKSGSYIDYLIVHHEELTCPDYKHLICWSGIESSNSSLFSCKSIRRDGTLISSSWYTDDEDEKKRVFNIRNVALQSILLLQYYPELASKEVDIKKIINDSKKGFAAPAAAELDYRSPRWLGEESRSENRNGFQPQEAGNGTKKSKHYRKKHWRKLADNRLVRVRGAWVNT